MSSALSRLGAATAGTLTATQSGRPAVASGVPVCNRHAPGMRRTFAIRAALQSASSSLDPATRLDVSRSSSN